MLNQASCAENAARGEGYDRQRNAIAIRIVSQAGRPFFHGIARPGVTPLGMLPFGQSRDGLGVIGQIFDGHAAQSYQV